MEMKMELNIEEASLVWVAPFLCEYRKAWPLFLYQFTMWALQYFLSFYLIEWKLIERKMYFSFGVRNENVVQ